MSFTQKTTYNAYYGDFRGVDFSSDHTQVNRQRLAYAVNMYKDYQSGQGQALETIPGFRRRLELPDAPTIYGIHEIDVREGSGTAKRILIHGGEKLYLWRNYPLTANVEHRTRVVLPAPDSATEGVYTFITSISESVAAITEIELADGTVMNGMLYSYDPEGKKLTVSSRELSEGDELYLSYLEGVINGEDALFDGMNCRKSASFIFNNRLYIIDGKNYLVYDGSTVKNVVGEAYIPTTYINIIPAGENADIGTQYEQRNVLQPKFKHTFVADGETVEFYMNENQLEEICEVKVYGEIANDWESDLAGGKITFTTAPKKPEDAGYTEFYAGIEITAKRTLKAVSGVTEEKENIYELITDCTIATVYDNRVFFSGNPGYPNHVFYCGRNITGYIDPTYFGVLNYMQDGVGIAPITGMMAVADTLMVLKSDTQQDGSVYFHTPTSTGEDMQPVIYPSTQGLNGIGCLGACVNFLDDPVFISRLGVEAIGQLSVRYERAMEHRSGLIDAKLLCTKLSETSLAEWNGYLAVLINGEMFLADSRQRYTHDNGNVQYEWYYAEEIGVYKNQYDEYRYSQQLYPELEGATVKWCQTCRRDRRSCTCDDGGSFIDLPLRSAEAVYDHEMGITEDLRGTIANAPDYTGQSEAVVLHDYITYLRNDEECHITVSFTVHEIFDALTGEHVEYEALICETPGNKTGGSFYPGKVVKTVLDNLYFGTEGGTVCSFNFDKRSTDGSIPTSYYSFDGRTILCGCATRMDNCDIPHLTKTTVKKSTVIKTRSMEISTAKVRVRTNRKPYEQIARINSAQFSFENLDFSDMTFVTQEQSLFAVKEKEKKWVEKQYYIYSDEYLKPFALFYLSYRYTIAGRYKE